MVFSIKETIYNNTLDLQGPPKSRIEMEPWNTPRIRTDYIISSNLREYLGLT